MHSIKCIIFLFLAFFSTENSFSQSIDSPTITGTSFCAGSDILVEFKVRNGNTAAEYFTTSTNYTAYIGKVVNGFLEVEFSFSFQSNTQPEQKNNKELIIKKSINIPDETIGDLNYVMGISSISPDVNTTTITISNEFVIKTKPLIEASNNGPICIGESLQLTSSINVSGATFSWTGPNGFNSVEQNPIRPNFSLSMAGQYQLVATLNGCQSLPSQTIVTSPSQYIWTGATDTNWNEPTNWFCSTIPDATTDVLIPSGITNNPILNTGVIGACKNITIDSGSSLSVLNNTLNISGIIISNGNFEASNGTIEMTGSNSQTIPANMFNSNRIRNLIINNINGVSSLGNLEITGFLRVDQPLSTFDSGNMLTLISDATQTALIDGSGKGDVIGTVKMQRYLSTALGYKYFSSPFSNSSVNDLSTYVDLNANFPQVYSYDESNTDGSSNDITGWKPYTTDGLPLGTLEGYAFNFGAAGIGVTVELNGTVNNGDFSRQLLNSNGIYTKGFNLVGNPYPSPINWDSPGWTKTNIDDAIYLFSATSQYKGTYTSVVNNISSTDGSSSRVIPSMQGFFVHVSDGGDTNSKTTGVLTITNDVRVNDFNQEFIKSAEANSTSLVRLSIGFNQNSPKDAMVIYFDPLANQSFDKNLDALKLMNTDEEVPNIYSLTSKSEKLSINALPESLKSSNQRIPLGIRSEIDGEMSIKLKDIENLPVNFHVYLIDEIKRIGQNLSEKPSYNFQMNAGENNSRFYLLFSEYELSDPAIAFNEPFSVKTNEGQVYVTLNLESGVKGTLLATTVTGQILEVNEVNGNETIRLDGIKSSGIYFISLRWKDQNFSKKIMIQK